MTLSMVSRATRLRLCVEQDDDSGDPGAQREVMTGEQAAEQGPQDHCNTLV
jgi:hypothetical protein